MEEKRRLQKSIDRLESENRRLKDETHELKT